MTAPNKNALPEINSDDELLLALQERSFAYFRRETNPKNGLSPDSTQSGSPASIACVGIGVTSYLVAAERGLTTRAEAIERTLAALRFFHDSPQETEPDATGYKGFYYHFLDKNTGKRAWECELSSIDTALLVIGFLTAAQYFQEDSADEKEIRDLVDKLYRRVEWDWMLAEGAALAQGWKSECGFLPTRWQGYSEGILLYLLALGSPTHPIPSASWLDWTATYQWREVYGIEYLHAGPLFIHQLPHCWIDFRGLQDAYMREKALDYFDNSRRAAFIQQKYAIDNPHKFAGYGADCWGLTASEGPGPAHHKVHGRDVKFYGYKARGVPDGPDDGTIAPWCAITSLPFAPEIVLPAIRHFQEIHLGSTTKYGFEATFNPTFSDGKTQGPGWVENETLGLNQGPVALMIENYFTGQIWRLTRGCPYLIEGLKRAGFTGGWLL